MSPVGLVLGTVPLAGLVLAGRQESWSDLFIVSYVGAVGLVLSCIAMFNGWYSLTKLVGVSTQALAGF